MAISLTFVALVSRKKLQKVKQKSANKKVLSRSNGTYKRIWILKVSFDSMIYNEFK